MLEGLESTLYLGNLDSLRDWGHAKDYVEMQWLMLQQEVPDDFVIATGVQYSVRQFITWAAEVLGIRIEFEGEGVHEVGVVSSVGPEFSEYVSVGQVIIRVNPAYFRPAEVETLLGDATKAKTMLGWEPKITTKEMCSEMVLADLRESKAQLLASGN